MKKKLGRDIHIPADAKVESGVTKIIFVEKTYEINIAIGKDHTATLYIGEEALKALTNPKNKITT